MDKPRPQSQRPTHDGLTTKHLGASLVTRPGSVEGQKGLTTAHQPQALGPATPAGGSTPAPTSGGAPASSKAKT